MRGLKFFCFLGLLPVICSCSFLEDRYFHFDQDRFEAEKGAWEKQDMGRYTFVQKFSSDAVPHGYVKIIVFSEKEAPIIENLDESGTPSEAYLNNTISGIYESIGLSVAGARKYYEDKKCHAVDFDITYHPQYHYPESVNYRVWYTEGNMVDGGPGYTLTITEFTPLP